MQCSLSVSFYLWEDRDSFEGNETYATIGGVFPARWYPKTEQGSQQPKVAQAELVAAKPTTTHTAPSYEPS